MHVCLSVTTNRFIGSLVSILRSVIAPKFSTGPEIFRRAERKETIDALDVRFQSEMLLGKNEYL